MSLLFSEASSKEDSLPDQIYQPEEEKSTTTIGSVPNSKLDNLKNFLPKPKPAITPKLQKVLNTRQGVTRRDFVSGPVEPSEYAERGKPFVYPPDLMLFGYQIMTKAWRENRKVKELQKQLKEKKTAQGKLNANILERLKVEDPPKDGRIFIQDINKDYLKIIEGRPFGDINTSVRSYIEMVRDVLKTKIILGYREDDLYLIEAKIQTEQRMIEMIKKEYQKYVSIFEDFLSRDHLTAITLLKRSNLLANELFNTNLEYKKIYKLLKGMTISLYKSESMWRDYKFYQKFLFNCSPLHWRLEHRNLLVLYEDKFKDSVRPESLLELGEGLSQRSEITLEEILEEVKQECKHRIPQEIYFTNPQELLDLFDYMETQNLNNLLHKEELAQPLALICDNMKTAEFNLDTMIDYLQNNVKKLEKEITWEENRVEELENMAEDLIFKDLKEIVSSEEALNLYCYVEDIFESLIGVNDTGYSANQMIALIEDHYRNELFYLDKVPSELVAQLETSTIKEHKQTLKFAEKAQKQIAELDNLTKAIKKGYLPPYEKPRYKPVVFRSPPLDEYVKPRTPLRDLSGSEMEYLDHFTQFCKHCDDPKDFGIDMTKKREVKDSTEEDLKVVTVNTI